MMGRLNELVACCGQPNTLQRQVLEQRLPNDPPFTYEGMQEYIDSIPDVYFQQA